MNTAGFQVRRFENPVEFAALTNSFLLEHEAENCFFIGHVPSLTNPTNVLLFAITDAAGAVAAVALMTPGRHMVATRASADAVVAFARHLHAGMGVHQATQIIPPARPAPGRMRTAHTGDLKLLTQWASEFAREIGEPHLADPSITRRRIDKGQLLIWEDAGRSVAMAGSAGATPNGIRINAVYTPPVFRNRGYASTLVATLSQQLLDAGRRFCFLYTDLANPTSNKIYRAIGYEPIAESVRVEFDRATTGR